ncbi:helix-turn-helix domain-containing protein [Marinobacter sp. 1-4A]|uniref:helix-turn-helix domain-containing protein n=1 Tax=unclassified Marinobacter TaxID=83889 RepID=UPI00190412D6|nr:helix-turn-helix domain-containing protein [Marinobacter sp. 1-4A]MBK1852087.1 helix-turn-helix domain-containing protein [Marinobacter sp. 1-4A]
MLFRAGISRQQYQRLESKGNPRLDTLELIAQALSSELTLIPKDKLGAVIAVLEQKVSDPIREDATKDLNDGPWKSLLRDD